MALSTGAALMDNLILRINIGTSIDTLAHPLLEMAGRVLAGVGALAIVYAAAFRWGRRTAQSSGAADAPRAGRLAALFFGLPVILAGAGLAALEPIAVERGGQLGLQIHAVYTVLFVSATLLVASAGSYGLGLGLRDRGLGARLALRAGPVAAGAFLLVAAIMYALGWQVGAPHAGERATMLVVTFLGLSAAALVAGTVIGRNLPSP